MASPMRPGRHHPRRPAKAPVRPPTLQEVGLEFVHGESISTLEAIRTVTGRILHRIELGCVVIAMASSGLLAARTKPQRSSPDFRLPVPNRAGRIRWKDRPFRVAGIWRLAGPGGGA